MAVGTFPPHQCKPAVCLSHRTKAFLFHSRVLLHLFMSAPAPLTHRQTSADIFTAVCPTGPTDKQLTWAVTLKLVKKMNIWDWGKKKKKKQHSFSRKAGRGREGDFGNFGDSSLSFSPARPLWHYTTEAEYLHGRLPRHGFNEPSSRLTRGSHWALVSRSCLSSCHHHQQPLCGRLLFFEPRGDNQLQTCPGLSCCCVTHLSDSPVCFDDFQVEDSLIDMETDKLCFRRLCLFQSYFGRAGSWQTAVQHEAADSSNNITVLTVDAELINICMLLLNWSQENTYWVKLIILS